MYYWMQAEADWLPRLVEETTTKYTYCVECKGEVRLNANRRLINHLMSDGRRCPRTNTEPRLHVFARTLPQGMKHHYRRDPARHRSIFDTDHSWFVWGYASPRDFLLARQAAIKAQSWKAEGEYPVTGYRQRNTVNGGLFNPR